MLLSLIIRCIVGFVGGCLIQYAFGPTLFSFGLCVLFGFIVGTA